LHHILLAAKALLITVLLLPNRCIARNNTDALSKLTVKNIPDLLTDEAGNLDERIAIVNTLGTSCDRDTAALVLVNILAVAPPKRTYNAFGPRITDGQKETITGSINNKVGEITTHVDNNQQVQGYSCPVRVAAARRLWRIDPGIGWLFIIDSPSGLSEQEKEYLTYVQEILTVEADSVRSELVTMAVGDSIASMRADAALALIIALEVDAFDPEACIITPALIELLSNEDESAARLASIALQRLYGLYTLTPTPYGRDQLKWTKWWDNWKKSK